MGPTLISGKTAQLHPIPASPRKPQGPGRIPTTLARFSNQPTRNALCLTMNLLHTSEFEEAVHALVFRLFILRTAREKQNFASDLGNISMLYTRGKLLDKLGYVSSSFGSIYQSEALAGALPQVCLVSRRFPPFGVFPRIKILRKKFPMDCIPSFCRGRHSPFREAKIDIPGSTV